MFYRLITRKKMSDSMSTEKPIEILEIVSEEVTRPRMDGTKGSGLYAVPVKLSRTPSRYWAKAFLYSWSQPPRWTMMHRQGIARISGDRIVLDGTTIEEVRDHHRDTLMLCVNQASEMEMEFNLKQERKKQQENEMRKSHDETVNSISKEIKFE